MKTIFIITDYDNVFICVIAEIDSYLLILKSFGISAVEGSGNVLTMYTPNKNIAGYIRPVELDI